MAINGKTLAVVDGLLTDAATPEVDFQTGATDLATQLDQSVNTVTLTGDVTGTATLAAGTTDNALSIATTIPADSITNAEIANGTIRDTELQANIINAANSDGLIRDRAIDGEKLMLGSVGGDEISYTVGTAANTGNFTTFFLFIPE